MLAQVEQRLRHVLARAALHRLHRRIEQLVRRVGRGADVVVAHRAHVAGLGRELRRVDVERDDVVDVLGDLGVERGQCGRVDRHHAAGLLGRDRRDRFRRGQGQVSGGRRRDGGLGGAHSYGLPRQERGSAYCRTCGLCSVPFVPTMQSRRDPGRRSPRAATCEITRRMAIQLHNVGFAYPGGDLLFDDVSFRVASGDRVALVGPNGVGKSTILRLLAGELTPTRGHVPARRFGRRPRAGSRPHR